MLAPEEAEASGPSHRLAAPQEVIHDYPRVSPEGPAWKWPSDEVLIDSSTHCDTQLYSKRLLSLHLVRTLSGSAFGRHVGLSRLGWCRIAHLDRPVYQKPQALHETSKGPLLSEPRTTGTFTEPYSQTLQAPSPAGQALPEKAYASLGAAGWKPQAQLPGWDNTRRALKSGRGILPA